MFEDSPSVVLDVAPEGVSMPEDAYVLRAQVEDLAHVESVLQGLGVDVAPMAEGGAVNVMGIYWAFYE